jgi:hypothetical protein
MREGRLVTYSAERLRGCGNPRNRDRIIVHIPICETVSISLPGHGGRRAGGVVEGVAFAFVFAAQMRNQEVGGGSVVLNSERFLHRHHIKLEYGRDNTTALTGGVPTEILPVTATSLDTTDHVIC